MKWMLIAVAALSMTGCATYSELQGTPPRHTAMSAETPQQVVECVLPRWMEQNASAHIVPDGDVRTIVVPGSGQFANLALATLTATPTASGSRVEYRSPPRAHQSYYDKQWAEVAPCL